MTEIVLPRQMIHTGNLILVNSEYAYSPVSFPDQEKAGIFDNMEVISLQPAVYGEQAAVVHLQELQVIQGEQSDAVHLQESQVIQGGQSGAVHLQEPQVIQGEQSGVVHLQEPQVIQGEQSDAVHLQEPQVIEGEQSGAAQPVMLSKCAVRALSELMREMNGWQHIVPVSGWRSMQEQQQIWDDSLAENGQKFTETYVAVPGHSEHQTGLAIDLGKKQETIDFIRPEFPYEGICQTFRDRAAEYGFVERYPKGKEAITGIGHEPWHFRYVGVPHAAIMTANGFTLEEYISYLRQFPYGESTDRKMIYRTDRGWEIRISFLEAAAGRDVTLKPDQKIHYGISGNNVDGFILTEWRRAHA